MAARHKSKIDTWLIVVLASAAAVSLFAGVTAVMADARSGWWALAMCLAFGVGLPLWLILGTEYRLESSRLHVRSGPFRWSIPVREITAVEPTRNPLSSPALSLDRLRIDYGRGKSVMISPRDRERFLRDLEAARRHVR
jgi:hypothetical protein